MWSGRAMSVFVRVVVRSVGLHVRRQTGCRRTNVLARERMYRSLSSKWICAHFRLLMNQSGDSEGTPEKFGGDRSWLAKSGFHTAVKDGRIEFEATA